MSLGAAALLPQWTFDADPQGWAPNSHLENVRIEEGCLKADAVNWDPMFILGGLEIPATPWQYVAIRIQASKPGSGELFWTGETSGDYGGFSPNKSTRFEVQAGEFQDIAVFPFWQAEKTVRQLRLDLYDGAQFAMDSIKIVAWGTPESVQTDVFAWDFEKPQEKWRSIQRTTGELFAPPLDLPIDAKSWAVIELESPAGGVGEVLWAAPTLLGAQSASFPLKKDTAPRFYNVELKSNPAWAGSICALGLRLPVGCRVKSFRLNETPDGPAEISVQYFGLENAIPRPDAQSSVLVQFTNTGGLPTEPTSARLVLPAGMTLIESKIEQPLPPLQHGEQHELRWPVKARSAGTFDLLLGYGKTTTLEAKVLFEEAIRPPRADYVPQPQPVFTPFDVCAYYFPGWDSYSKWDCVRSTAPNRKPALGYYDEGNPECVDWQIKWAVENAISCFLVDWYWCDGKQQLTHWFDAYRKAKYRDMLKVAIMWANHNPPGTHSAEDFRKVAREWIDNYFNLPGYFRINGKPAVFIWAPSNIRADLKGSEAVKKTLDEAQEAARAAGYPGIAFVAMGYDFSKANVDSLVAEGYSGITTYHEWGALQSAQGPQRVKFEDAVNTAAQSWTDKNAAAAPLAYYPVIDTGWDSRPWHGDKALVLEGRTPELFYRLLQGAWQFAVNNDKKIVILGPLNEWGEGSYIEPCVEFGFKMYEAVREVFAPGADRPINIAPADLGRGPFDYLKPEPPAGG
jgi:hypothetical protein